MPDPRRIPAALVLVAISLLGGCATAPPAAAPAPDHTPPLPTTHASVYRVVPGRSRLRIRVYRGGPLAEVGHNHVITSSDVHGRIYLHHSLDASGFELKVPVNSFRVDPPTARRQAGKGFGGQLTGQDRRGTRQHMLGPRVLDAAKYPAITLRSVAVTGPPWDPRVTVRISLHGVSRDYVVPTAVVRRRHCLVAIGELHLKQTAFGIKPYSVLAGGLRIKNGIDVAFRIVAVPTGPRPASGRGT